MEICYATYGGNSKFSLFAILQSKSLKTSYLGAGTLICKHLDLKGAITLDRLSQLAMILQVGINVSIVRRNEAYAVCVN